MVFRFQPRESECAESLPNIRALLFFGDHPPVPSRAAHVFNPFESAGNEGDSFPDSNAHS